MNVDKKRIVMSVKKRIYAILMDIVKIVLKNTYFVKIVNILKYLVKDGDVISVIQN
jgi:hypothetical protein